MQSSVLVHISLLYAPVILAGVYVIVRKEPVRACVCVCVCVCVIYCTVAALGGNLSA